VTGVAIALFGALGVHLLVTSLSARQRAGGEATVTRPARPGRRERIRRWMDQAGLASVSPSELAAATAAVAVGGALCGVVLFGGVVPALVLATFAGCAPLGAYRHRRTVRTALAEESWPAMIEEIRVLCGSAGRSIPQALLDVGLRGPGELRPAFEAARRTWALTTDFGATVGVLKDHLASPTADATCETLLVAHELGGSDFDRRLAELAEDRRTDVAGRKDARSKQAGVRFARRFVVVVPLGMAVAGMSLGNGRAAYQTATGQALVAVGLGLVVACWVWSGRILRMPTEERVFT
jgi:tight adherence protein B